MSKKITLEKLAQMIAKGFETTATKTDLEKVKKGLKEVKDDLKGVKDDLGGVKDDLKETKESLSKQINNLRGDLILIVRKEDRKLETVINILERKNIFTKDDIKEISKIRIFPKIEISA